MVAQMAFPYNVEDRKATWASGWRVNDKNKYKRLKTSIFRIYSIAWRITEYSSIFSSVLMLAIENRALTLSSQTPMATTKT